MMAISGECWLGDHRDMADHKSFIAKRARNAEANMGNEGKS